MEQKAGAQISQKAFIQSMFILLGLMIAAGLLTRVVPSGSYDRIVRDGRTVIDPGSFQLLARPAYPVYRWFTAPLEVPFGPDGILIITISVFVLMVGGAFAVLDKCGILHALLGRIVRAFGAKKYVLLLVVSFFFMVLGAFFGLFEEVVPLVPLMVALAYYLGWDALVGLGMSILATNMGFSAALTNPFSIGVAQRLAGLPLFSGISLHIPFFVVVYILLAVFLVRYARRIDHRPEDSLLFGEDRSERVHYQQINLAGLENPALHLGRAMTFFAVFLALIVLVLFGTPFLPLLADLALPLVGVLFFIGGVGAGLLSGGGSRLVLKALAEGISGIAPGAPLILMAASVKHIVTQGAVLDTILNRAAQSLEGVNPFTGVLIVYFLALLIELFIGSAGAKAVLLMPILLPLADLVGVTRQATVLAYCFGDGFSNLAYPTNPVLLISLGLAGVNYGRWMRWTLKLWMWVILLSVVFLGIGVAINYGPF